jgi:hypothetical protein
MKEIHDALLKVMLQEDAGSKKLFKAVYFLLKLIVLKLGDLNEKIQKRN